MILGCLGLLAVGMIGAWAEEHPNLVLVMADDQGWGEVGYYDHPVLKTPNLDAMAANALRFDRFYAGAPNCSPTRATVLTGRSNDRCGVQNHGYPLRRQEQTLAQALQRAGYATGHFGKWHLNGHRGPGAPILAGDDHHPGVFGFDEWLSMSNFFDRDPIMSRNGRFEEFRGDSSEIIAAEALKFMKRQTALKQPFLAVIWYGSPHSPWVADAADRESFQHLSENEQNHYGELVAMDRSIGALRRGLRGLGIADNTLVWYCSDNGGLQPFGTATVGGLRGWKGTIYEGGLRVPALIEWPAVIKTPRVTSYPACTMDIFPTLAEIVGLPDTAGLQPQDGLSLLPLFQKELGSRPKPIPFRHTGRAAWIDNDDKLLIEGLGKGDYQLYNLETDPGETMDLSSERPQRFEQMKMAFEAWNRSVEASVAGKDYPEGQVDPAERGPGSWVSEPGYAPYLREWALRPEYRAQLKRFRESPQSMEPE